MTVDRSSTRAHQTHQGLIVEQFSRQAGLFAQSPALHNEAALSLLVEASAPQPSDTTLDVACGPGSVVVAFARVVRKSVGLDATPAMLQEAKEARHGEGRGQCRMASRRRLRAAVR